MSNPMEPTPAEEIAELRSMAADWQRQCHQYEAAILAAGGTTGYGENGEAVVTWPTKKEWRVIWDYGRCNCSNEREADRHVTDYKTKERYANLRKQFRTTVFVFIPSPWQDS